MKKEGGKIRNPLIATYYSATPYYIGPAECSAGNGDVSVRNNPNCGEIPAVKYRMLPIDCAIKVCEREGVRVG